jgi:transposase
MAQLVPNGFVAMLEDPQEFLDQQAHQPQPSKRTKLTAEKIAVATAMFSAGQRPSDVATAVGCSLRKAQQLKKDTNPEFDGGQRKPYVPQKRGRKSQPQVSEVRRQMVRNVLVLDPSLEQAAVSEMLPTPVHYSTISRDIKSLGWSRKQLQKVPFERNTPENLHRRRLFAETTSLISDNRLVYIDETGFNLHVSSTHGYSPSGQPAVLMVQANRGQNMTAIVAISAGGMLHYKLKDGAANGVVFSEFLEELVPFLPPQPVIVMDNVRFHHGQQVQQWAAENQHFIRVEYLPPYSPELNPIEEFFHMAKNAYRKKNRPVSKTRAVMRIRVIDVLESLQNRDLSGLYRHMREFLAIAYAGQPLH